ncbi:MAG: hypothetical protein COA67_04765 [Lutibacter sp.]|nr:MAG: hypothetical protein COA67_04765 [Lutibacter sp.]
MSKFFISCDEATTICDKSQYGEITVFDKIKLNFHFLICKYCKTYTKQNTLLSKIFGNYAKGHCEEQRCMSSQDKEKIETEVKKKLK